MTIASRQPLSIAALLPLLKCDSDGNPTERGIYYRVQPHRRGLRHKSQTSEGGQATGLHVFSNAYQALHPDGPLENYGDELVVLTAPRDWDNGDVEGVCVNGAEARIIERLNAQKALRIWDGE